MEKLKFDSLAIYMSRQWDIHGGYHEKRLMGEGFGCDSLETQSTTRKKFCLMMISLLFFTFYDLQQDYSQFTFF